MTWSTGLLGFAAGLLISVATAPVGVSGAVFLLPVQISVLGVPSPAVTPTNLLYNVVAGPGALLRHHRAGTLRGPLTRLLVLGTVPGVVVGAVIRVFAVPGPTVFRLLIAVLLLPLGSWLCLRTLRRASRTTPSGSPRPAPSPGWPWRSVWPEGSTGSAADRFSARSWSGAACRWRRWPRPRSPPPS